jgi:hypothetical protein
MKFPDKIVKVARRVPSPILAAVAAVGVTVSLWVLPGSIIPHAIAPSEISVLSSRSLLEIGGLGIFGSFAVFLMLFWFPRGETMMRNAITSSTSGGTATFPGSKVEPEVRLPGKFVLSSLSGLAAGAVFFLLVRYLPDDAIEWFEVTGWTGSAFGIAYAWVNWSALTYACLGIVEFMVWFERVIRRGVTIEPLNPDRCGGLGPISACFVRLGWFGIAFGVWVVWVIGLAFWWNWPDRPDMYVVQQGAPVWALLFAIYASLLWFLLFRPLLSLRAAMIKARSSAIQPLVARFSAALRGMEDDQESRFKELTRLRSLIELIQETHPTSPISVPTWRAVSLLSLTPPTLGLISVTVNFATGR